MAMTDSVVRARIEPELKKQATAVLAQMGLSVSDAIRMLLTRVAADEALPFEVRTPNARTRAAMKAAEKGHAQSFDSIDDLMADLNADD
ncbi:MAG TPA: type II toxin-antitoxin system RelB/DinJ family antitoxin [Caulobacteraceae bacterium]